MKGQKYLYSVAILAASSIGLTGCNIDLNSEAEKLGKAIQSYSKTNTGVISDINDTLHVNGVDYDIKDAEIWIDGLLADSASLKPGMVVSVSGIERSDNTGIADQVYFEDEVEGSVLGNTIQADGSGFLNILGQSVTVDQKTVFESYDVSDLSFTDIDEGNIVEVSGYSSGDGEIHATRIEVKNLQYNVGEEVELKGVVANLNNSSFSIGNLQVDYQNAVLDNDFMGNLENGQYVEVKSYEGFDDNGVFLASEIELKSSSGKTLRYDDDDERVEIEGLITKLNDDGSIEVNGARVSLADNLVNNTSLLNSLQQGQLIEVEGYLDSNGYFVATKLERESDDSRDDSDDDSRDDSDDDSRNDSSDDDDRNSDLDSDNDRDDDGDRDDD